MEVDEYILEERHKELLEAVNRIGRIFATAKPDDPELRKIIQAG